MAIRLKSHEAAGISGKRTGIPESNIIIFTSAKGGSGCSFIANSIAAYMAQKTTLNVLLLDMNIGRIESRMIFGLDKPSLRDISDIIPKAENIDTPTLKKVVINLENSLNIILPPLNIEKLPLFKGGNLSGFIEALRDHFDLICVDMPGYLFGHIDIEEIDISDRFIFVSLPDLYSASNIRVLMDYVRSYRSFQDFFLVINKYNLKPAISPTGLSNILKYPITSFIPYDRDIEELINTKGPEHIFKYNLKVVMNISGLAEKILEGLGL